MPVCFWDTVQFTRLTTDRWTTTFGRLHRPVCCCAGGVCWRRVSGVHQSHIHCCCCCCCVCSCPHRTCCWCVLTDEAELVVACTTARCTVNSPTPPPTLRRPAPTLHTQSRRSSLFREELTFSGTHGGDLPLIFHQYPAVVPFCGPFPFIIRVSPKTVQV